MCVCARAASVCTAPLVASRASEFMRIEVGEAASEARQRLLGIAPWRLPHDVEQVGVDVVQGIAFGHGREFYRAEAQRLEEARHVRAALGLRGKIQHVHGQREDLTDLVRLVLGVRFVARRLAERGIIDVHDAVGRVLRRYQHSLPAAAVGGPVFSPHGRPFRHQLARCPAVCRDGRREVSGGPAGTGHPVVGSMPRGSPPREPLRGRRGVGSVSARLRALAHSGQQAEQ